MILQNPKPHPIKTILKKNNISVASVAQHLGLSFTYVTNLINGAARVTPENEAKLQEIISYLGGKHDGKDGKPIS